MPADAHSCPTDSNESLMVGTQRTPERVSSILFPLSSRADTHMSPMAVQRCGAPSTPRTEVPHGTALIKSPMQGWM
eukprot:1197703-Pleurochrysis_carterae.AAC.1